RAGDGLGPCARHAGAHPAQRAADHHRRRDHRSVDGDPHRGQPLLPRPRRAAALPDVGRHALADGPRPHVPGAVARDLAGGGAVAGLDLDVQDAYALPYRERFDVVSAARVLQWLAEPARALAAMARATRPGGRVVVLDYNHEQLRLEPSPPASARDFLAAFLDW